MSCLTSRKFRLEVGVQAQDAMISVMEADRSDEELIGYALDTLCNICSPEDFDEELDDSKNAANGGIGEQVQT